MDLVTRNNRQLSSSAQTLQRRARYPQIQENSELIFGIHKWLTRLTFFVT